MSELNSSNHQMAWQELCDKYDLPICRDNPDSTPDTPPPPDDGMAVPLEIIQYIESIIDREQVLQPDHYNIIAAMCNISGMPQFAERFAQAAIELAPEADHLIRAEAWQRRADAFHRQNLPELENQAIEQAINSLAMARS